VLTVDDAEPRDPVGLGAATKLARTTLESQFPDGISLGATRNVSLGGAPARRFEGTDDERRVAVVVAVRGEKTFTLTLNAPLDVYSARPLDAAVRSWRWD